ncbi:MAG: hypothetical protein ABIR59_03120 [Gemmatimonadales bacterium]
MTRLALLAVCALVPACSWSNSLYHARRISDQAISLERNDRPFEATSAWASAAVKADTAYSRNPEGRNGAEALWLRGRARARSGDCPGAIASLDAARNALPNAEWREPLEFELAGCLDKAGDPRARELFIGLQSSADPEVRENARTRAGRSHVLAREWDAALTVLDGIDAPGVRMDRAVALAGLGRGAEVWTELEPLLSEPDTARDWRGVVESFAASDRVVTDSLLTRLTANGSVAGERRNALLYAAARGALRTDRGAADSRLEMLVAINDPNLSMQGRLMIAERLLAGASSAATLRVAVDSLAQLSTDDGSTAGRFAVLGRLAEGLRVQHDSLISGTPQGDMLTFIHGEVARDSLRAPALATYFFSRLERDWPLSPYLAKALLARIALEPDSAEALRERVVTLVESPYVAYLEGREDMRFGELELALMIFAQNRRVRSVTPARPRPTTVDVPVGGVDIP